MFRDTAGTKGYVMPPDIDKEQGGGEVVCTMHTASILLFNWELKAGSYSHNLSVMVCEKMGSKQCKYPYI